jgi:hypothetical protein
MTHMHHLRYSYHPLLLAAVLLSGSTAFAQDAIDYENLELIEGDECVACHADLEEMPPGFAPYDVHYKEGLSCAGCHGGDATSFDEEESMSKAAGFIGVPEPKEIAALCGKCHSDPNYMRGFNPALRIDMEAQYHTSGHGIAVSNGDENAATCVSCHSAHSILPATDPRAPVYALNVPDMCNSCHGDTDLMAGYRIEKDVYSKYAAGVHGIALLEEEDTGAPACNDCHGNHGAMPPDVNSLADVCGTCHPNNQRLFETSPMHDPFAEDQLHGCIECHGHHEVEHPELEMVGVGDESICLDCHGEGERGYDVADSMYHHISRLVALNDSAISLKAEVARVGMDDIDIEYLLIDAHQSLIQSKTLVHSFDASIVAEETEKGSNNALAAIALGYQRLEEHSDRQMGFAIASFFATLLVVALYLKLREIERASPTEKNSPPS